MQASRRGCPIRSGTRVVTELERGSEVAHKPLRILQDGRVAAKNLLQNQNKLTVEYKRFVPG